MAALDRFHCIYIHTKPIATHMVVTADPTAV